MGALPVPDERIELPIFTVFVSPGFDILDEEFNFRGFFIECAVSDGVIHAHKFLLDEGFDGVQVGAVDECVRGHRIVPVCGETGTQRVGLHVALRVGVYGHEGERSIMAKPGDSVGDGFAERVGTVQRSALVVCWYVHGLLP